MGFLRDPPIFPFLMAHVPLLLPCLLIAFWKGEEREQVNKAILCKSTQKQLIKWHCLIKWDLLLGKCVEDCHLNCTQTQKLLYRTLLLSQCVALPDIDRDKCENENIEFGIVLGSNQCWSCHPMVTHGSSFKVYLQKLSVFLLSSEFCCCLIYSGGDFWTASSRRQVDPCSVL